MTAVNDQKFILQQFPEKLAVVRLAPGAEIPQWAESSSLFSITATATETSLVCATRSVPTSELEPSTVSVTPSTVAPTSTSTMVKVHGDA